jgi:hypothetical protein
MDPLAAPFASTPVWLIQDVPHQYDFSLSYITPRARPCQCTGMFQVQPSKCAVLFGDAWSAHRISFPPADSDVPT